MYECVKQLNITVCDDEPVQVAYLSDLVRKWTLARNITVRFSDYESAESYLFAREDDKSADILLLDIQMKNMDGVELAKQIRSEDETVQIVFITGFPDYIAEGYEVSALHYLMKPVNETKLFEVLDRAVKNTKKRAKLLLFDTNSGSVRLTVDEIMYAEVFDHYLEIVTANDKYRVKMPLYSLEQELTEDFVRCHRGYIVNMQYIRKITKTEVILDCGQIIPLSRRLYPDVNKAMLEFLKGSEELTREPGNECL